MSDSTRESTRHRCRIRVLIRVRGREYGGYVIDISEDGMQLSTDRVAGIWTGDEVEVTGAEFGPVAGKAQWRVPGRFGVKFMANTADSAGLRDLWRYSPPD